MANQFDFLAKAKPASLYKLLEKLPKNEAAIVLTGLPHTLAIQSLAYFPEHLQGAFLPLMREARAMPEQQRNAVAGKIRAMLDAAKSAQGAGQPPAPPKTMMGLHNPYESAPQPKPPLRAEKAAPPQPSPLAGLGSKLRDVLGRAASPAPGRKGDGAEPRPPARQQARPQREEGQGKPVPWLPRAATSSPINGPAMPGGKPPVTGDPFTSPLAQAGLLDLIGRAQERLMPRGGAPRPGMKHALPPQPPARPRPGAKPGRPEPREGVISLDATGFNKTPRVIGPQPKRKSVPAPDAPESGEARRMDGKAILAAILREAGPEVRESVREDDPGLMRELRGRMFYFDDLLCTDDAGLARVFTAAPADTAALALKFAPPELRRRALRAVSPGRARALEEPPGKAGFDAIEAAQKKVLDVALQLQAAGRILIDPRDPDLAGEA